MIRPLRSYLLLIALLMTASAAGSQTADRQRPMTLGEELEGLAPGPRIAYLRYLLAGGRRDAEVHFQLGVAFYDAGEIDSAMVHYANAVAIDPRLSKAYVNTGVILDEEHRSAEAARMFEKAVAVNPLDILAHCYLAGMLLDAGQHEAASDHLSKALAIDSLHPQPHFVLALFFWESGMFRESLIEWENVVRLAPAGYLAKKAEENIAILRGALSGGRESAPPPRR
jgi:tetratricopeptide (TPR) repeat protein